MPELNPYPQRHELTPLNLRSLQKKDIGTIVLYVEADNREYGIYYGSDQHGARVHFASNRAPLTMNFDTRTLFHPPKRISKSPALDHLDQRPAAKTITK